MNKSSNIFARFFGVVVRGQTYANLLYLLLAFPLGLFYYIFLIIGFALGLPLTLVLVGILILLVMLVSWVAFVAFERQLAIWLLHVDVPPFFPRRATRQEGSPGLTDIFTNPVTWKGLLFLFLKFPLGLFSFVVLVSLIAITLALLSAPITYSLFPIQVWFYADVIWLIDTPLEAWIAFGVGVVMLFVTPHLLNALAWIWGRLAVFMLGNPLPPVEAGEAGPLVEVAGSGASAELAPKAMAEVQTGEIAADLDDTAEVVVSAPEEPPVEHVEVALAGEEITAGEQEMGTSDILAEAEQPTPEVIELPPPETQISEQDVPGELTEDQELIPEPVEEETLQEISEAAEPVVEDASSVGQEAAPETGEEQQAVDTQVPDFLRDFDPDQIGQQLDDPENPAEQHRS